MSAAPKLAQPRERPILFSAPMVRALLAGTKTQTRRLVKPLRGFEHNATCRPDMAADPCEVWMHGASERVGCLVRCPYGAPGDLLWVRETWQPIWSTMEYPPHGLASPEGWAISYPSTEGLREWHNEGGDGDLTTACRPSIHMPRWASRITLELSAVRVERLQDISEEDAKAEGVERDSKYPKRWRNYLGEVSGPNAVDSFMTLWSSINGTAAWDANPWVWALSFKRVAP